MTDFAFFSFLWVRRHRVFDNVDTVVVPIILVSEGSLETSMTLVAAGAPGCILINPGAVLTSESGDILISEQSGRNLGDLYRYD